MTARSLAPLAALLAALTLAACGDDEEEPQSGSDSPPAATATPSATASPSATATPKASATATPGPEEQPGGPGDEDNAVVGPITVFPDRIVPRLTEVEAGKKLLFISGEAQAVTVRISPPLAGESSALARGGGFQLDLAGAEPGDYELSIGGKPLGTIRIAAR